MKTDILTVVARFASQHCLFDTGNLIVGLSGGPDSVALITILAELRDRHESFPNLLAVHVNHNLRDNAKADEKSRDDVRNGLMYRSTSVLLT